MTIIIIFVRIALWGLNVDENRLRIARAKDAAEKYTKAEILSILRCLHTDLKRALNYVYNPNPNKGLLPGYGIVQALLTLDPLVGDVPTGCDKYDNPRNWNIPGVYGETGK